MDSAELRRRHDGLIAYNAGRSSESVPGLVAEVARLRAEVARLEGDIRARDLRTALVMHELRQAVSVLVLALSSLARRATGFEWGELERLKAYGLRLDRLVSDLSDTSFLDSGGFALQVASTDLASLVHHTLARHALRASVSIEGDIPAIEVDRQRVEQVLSNLLVNAYKHGSAEGTPEVAVARKGGVVVVSVVNDGCAIADDERTKVFEPYYRGRARRPGASGLGLGLYICRRLVEEHGGSIWTDGDASHTRVSFSLPIAPETPSGTRLAAEQGEQRSGTP